MRTLKFWAQLPFMLALMYLRNRMRPYSEYPMGSFDKEKTDDQVR